MIFFGLLDLFYDYPLDFGSIIHPQFFFLYMGYFDSVLYVVHWIKGKIVSWHKKEIMFDETF